MMIKQLAALFKNITQLSFVILLSGSMFAAGMFTGTSCVTERPMVIKYEYIDYPEFKGNLLDPSTDVNSVPRRTLINQNVMLMNYIKKLIRRSDMIDYLYFNVNKEHSRFEEFKGLDEVKDVEEFKKLYREKVGDTTEEPPFTP